MGGYDLHGNYYLNSRDAINAEIAQVAEIDARYASDQVRHVQRDMHRNEQLYSQYLEDMDKRLKYLEQPLLYYRDEMIKHNSKR